MKVLIACERSGVIRDAFCRLGHDAWSNDLEDIETEGEYAGNHLYGDCRIFIDQEWQHWDLLIAHPPCTYLCASGLHWNKHRPERAKLTDDALAFAVSLMGAPIPHIAMENPIGCLSTRYRKPDQTIQPYQFGHDASKTTGLWLKNLPPLRPTQFVEPRMIDGRPRWANQTNSGQNRLGPTPTRSQERARTYEGIAKAMAEQWGSL
jgi:hypothetical protein